MALSHYIRRRRGYRSAKYDTSVKKSVRAPVKGLNTRDSYAAMKPDYAVLMDNWWPDHGRLRLRQGYLKFVEGISPTTVIKGDREGVEFFQGGDPVETIVNHKSGVTDILYAFCGDSLWNITNQFLPRRVRTGLHSARWESVSFGGYTIMVNDSEEDEPITINPSGEIKANHHWIKDVAEIGSLDIKKQVKSSLPTPPSRVKEAISTTFPP